MGTKELRKMHVHVRASFGNKTLQVEYLQVSQVQKYRLSVCYDCDSVRIKIVHAGYILTYKTVGSCRLRRCSSTKRNGDTHQGLSTEGCTMQLMLRNIHLHINIHQPCSSNPEPSLQRLRFLPDVQNVIRHTRHHNLTIPHLQSLQRLTPIL
jgi:hypothetical protein